MGAQSSIYNTWDIEYFLSDYGWSDKQIEDWKVAFRGYSWIAPVILIGLLWLGNVGSHFAREHRKGQAIRHLLARDKAKNLYEWRKPALPRKDTSLSTTSTLVNDPDDGGAPPSKPLPPVPTAAAHGGGLSPIFHRHRRSRSASDALRRSVAFDPDMPYITEESSQSQRSSSARTKPDPVPAVAWNHLHVKRDMSRLDVLDRGSLRTVTAVWQAFMRTWVTWRRFEVFGVHFDLNELLWTLSYFGMMLVLGFAHTPGINQFTKTNVTIHRCSSVAVAQLPLVIGLASKNNLISYLTGISYERLNFLHRNAARVFYLFSLYHFGGHIYCGMTGHDAWPQMYVAAGCVALTCFTLIVIISWRPVRTRCYEFFLVSHIVLVALGLVFLLLHRLEYWPYIAVGMLLWSLDRFLRLFRLFVLNKLWRSFYGTCLQDNVAHVEMLSNGALLRVTMKRKYAWRAGKHAHLMMPTISRFPWEAHPFTIALMHHLDQERSEELMFLVGVQNGFTKRLLDKVDIAGGVLDVPCLVEAPYGTADDLSAYDQVVLCAGGAGMSYILNRLFELCAKRIDQQTCVQRVHVVWTVRNLDSLNWVNHLLAEAVQTTPPGFVQFHLFATREPSSQKGLEGMDTPFGRAARGRPDWEALLGSIIWDCSGNIAVHSCGPGPMSSNIATALASVYVPGEVAKGGASVDFHAETFGM